jgi:hypothetical protein
MNRLLIPTLAAAAVTLLSGCQTVTVRQYYPEPIQVIESHSTVYVEHRPAPVHRAPPVVVVRSAAPARKPAPIPPYARNRQRPEHGAPPAPRDERGQHRQPERRPQQERVVPATPQAKGLFATTAQAAHKLQNHKAHSEKTAATNSNKAKPEQKKPKQEK